MSILEWKYTSKGSALNSGFAFAWLLRMHILTGYLISRNLDIDFFVWFSVRVEMKNLNILYTENDLS